MKRYSMFILSSTTSVVRATIQQMKQWNLQFFIRRISMRNLCNFIMVLFISGILSGCGSKELAIESYKQENKTEASAENAIGFELLQISAPSLKNNMINESTKQGIGVYVPPSYYTSNKSYPVLYFLPGFGDSYISYIESFSSAMNVQPAKNKNNEMIVVTINGTNRLSGCMYANSPVTGNWEDFVTKDVIQYVDKNYRTIKKASARGIAGHSMGGTGAMNIAMHTKELFGYVYAMSPGIFDKNGLTKSDVEIKDIEKLIEQYKDMSKDAAKATYMEYIDTLGWSENLSFAVGSAYAYDKNAKAPYIKVPKKNEQGEYLQDDVWELYQKGFGHIPEKLKAYKDNLLKLKGFTIDYGIYDYFTWIVDGCKYFEEEMNKANIPFNMVSYNGDHESHIVERIQSEVIPFFLKGFSETTMPVPPKGTIKTIGSLKYKIAKSSKTGGNATIIGVKKGIKSVVIPGTVKINGYTFQVTSIEKNAFKSCGKLSKAIIGSNITSIGTNAFRNSGKLKNIAVKSKKLSKVGKSAIKGTNKKLRIKVLKKQLKKYKKLFDKKAGFLNTMKVIS